MNKPARIGTLVAVALLAGLPACSKNNKSTPLAPPAVELDGLVFNEILTCNQTPATGGTFCADNQVPAQLKFTKTSSNTYRIHDVPDTGVVFNGTLSGLEFTWNAANPLGYTETGTWTFASDGASFAGISHYVANDDSYSGDCSATGAKDPARPPAPTPVSPCR